MTESDKKVLSFPVITKPGTEPDKDVIEVAEKLLERAKNGELQFIAYSLAYDNEAVQHGWAGNPKYNHNIFASIADLQYEYAEMRNGDRADVDEIGPEVDE